MPDGVTLKLKSNNGDIMQLQIAELIEVDGRAYRAPEEFDEYMEVLNLIANRLERIEAVVCTAEPAGEE